MSSSSTYLWPDSSAMWMPVAVPDMTGRQPPGTCSQVICYIPWSPAAGAAPVPTNSANGTPPAAALLGSDQNPSAGSVSAVSRVQPAQQGQHQPPQPSAYPVLQVPGRPPTSNDLLAPNTASGQPPSRTGVQNMGNGFAHPVSQPWPESAKMQPGTTQAPAPVSAPPTPSAPSASAGGPPGVLGPHTHTHSQQPAFQLGSVAPYMPARMWPSDAHTQTSSYLSSQVQQSPAPAFVTQLAQANGQTFLAVGPSGQQLVGASAVQYHPVSRDGQGNPAGYPSQLTPVAVRLEKSGELPAGFSTTTKTSALVPGEQVLQAMKLYDSAPLVGLAHSAAASGLNNSPKVVHKAPTKAGIQDILTQRDSEPDSQLQVKAETGKYSPNSNSTPQPANSLSRSKDSSASAVPVPTMAGPGSNGIKLPSLALPPLPAVSLSSVLPSPHSGSGGAVGTGLDQWKITGSSATMKKSQDGGEGGTHAHAQIQVLQAPTPSSATGAMDMPKSQVFIERPMVKLTPPPKKKTKLEPAVGGVGLDSPPDTQIIRHSRPTSPALSDHENRPTSNGHGAGTRDDMDSDDSENAQLFQRSEGSVQNEDVAISVILARPSSAQPRSLPNGRFQCPLCPKHYKHSKHVRRHIINHTRMFPFVCPVCRMQFRRRDACRRHLQNLHATALESQNPRLDLTVKSYVQVRAGEDDEVAG